MEVLDMKYTQVLFKFPKDLKKAITELAKKKNTTQSEIVREAIRRYIISEEFRMLREKTLDDIVVSKQNAQNFTKVVKSHTKIEIL